MAKYGPDEMGATYLLLHGKNELLTNKLWRIKATPTLKSKQELLNLNYPTKPSREYYLVFEIEPVDLLLWGNKQWDIRNIKGFQSGRASAIPFSSTLSALTKASVSN